MMVNHESSMKVLESCFWPTGLVEGACLGKKSVRFGPTNDFRIWNLKLHALAFHPVWASDHLDCILQLGNLYDLLSPVCLCAETGTRCPSAVRNLTLFSHLIPLSPSVASRFSCRSQSFPVLACSWLRSFTSCRSALLFLGPWVPSWVVSYQLFY